MTPSKHFDIIAAVDGKWGISKDGEIPWAGTDMGQEDMEWFKYKTRFNPIAHTNGLPAVVIMGRRTWDSIPKPLRNRVNIVVSSCAQELTIQLDDCTTDKTRLVFVDSFNAALVWYFNAQGRGEVSKCFVCGGADIYKQALQSPYLRYAWITMIGIEYGCDKQFPHIYLEGVPVDTEKAIFRGPHACNKYVRYDFTNRDELSYLGLLRELLTAPKKPNRTGIAAHSMSHKSITLQLYEPGRGNVLPLLTTKKIIWKSIYHELMWFLRGSSNTDYLIQNGIHIWDGNSTRQFLDNKGLSDYRPGELGPIYGWQWRNWGRPYTPEVHRHEELNTSGYDQINEIITLIKRDPWDRRMVVSSWNVAQISDMALPPCHYSFQFNVDPDALGIARYLNCLVNMRSTDTFCGLPFNIASYALLTHMIAHIVGLTPGKLTISMCDAHLYENAVDQANVQLGRLPKRFPTLKFSNKILTARPSCIDDLVNESTINDYIIEDYVCEPYIKVTMAI